MPTVKSHFFKVVIVDDDNCLFSLVGPMANDTVINRRVDSFRAWGKNLRYYGLVDTAFSLEDFIAAITAQTGYRHVSNVFTAILLAPLLNTPIYNV